MPSLSAAAGLPEIDESATWIGLLAPAGTPGAIVDKLQAEVARIFADPAMQERLQKAGLFPVSSTPAEFDAFIRNETARWSKVIRENGHATRIATAPPALRAPHERGSTISGGVRESCATSACTSSPVIGSISSCSRAASAMNA